MHISVKYLKNSVITLRAMRKYHTAITAKVTVILKKKKKGGPVGKMT